MTEPKRDGRGNWDIPEGYAHGRCSGCGHIYYDSRPVPLVDGEPAKFSKCEWCMGEAYDDE